MIRAIRLGGWKTDCEWRKPYYEPTSAFRLRLPFDLNHCSHYMDSHVVRIIPVQQTAGSCWICPPTTILSGDVASFLKTIVRGTMPCFVCLSFHHQDLRQEQHQHGKAGEDPIVWRPKSPFQGFFQRVQTGGNRLPWLKRYVKQWASIWFYLEWFVLVQADKDLL